MNKSELIAAVADKGKLTKKYAEDAIDAVMDVIVKSVKSGDSVRLSGFGTFSLKKSPARVGRNPKTGQPVQIKAASTLKFVASKTALE